MREIVEIADELLTIASGIAGVTTIEEAQECVDGASDLIRALRVAINRTEDLRMSYLNEASDLEESEDRTAYLSASSLSESVNQSIGALTAQSDFYTVLRMLAEAKLELLKAQTNER